MALFWQRRYQFHQILTKIRHPGKFKLSVNNKLGSPPQIKLPGSGKVPGRQKLPHFHLQKVGKLAHAHQPGAEQWGPTGHTSTGLLCASLRASSPLTEFPAALQASGLGWVVVLTNVKPTEVQTALCWPRWADRLCPSPSPALQEPLGKPPCLCVSVTANQSGTTGRRVDHHH